jgi:hypothetical protein
MSNCDGITTAWEWKVGAFYRTRGGNKVECLKTDLNVVGSSFSIVGVEEHGGAQYVCVWKSDGSYTGNESGFDIVGPWVEPKRKKVVYEWVTQHGSFWLVSDILRTEEEAASYYGKSGYKKTGRQFEVEE